MRIGNIKTSEYSYKGAFRLSRRRALSLFAAVLAASIFLFLSWGAPPSAPAETRDEVRTLYKTGVDYINDMNYEAAEAVFRKIIEAGYEFPEAYNNLGYAKMRLSKDDEATFEFKNALRINPDFTDALNNLGILYTKHPATAQMGLQLLKKAVKLAPDNSSYHDSLGQCLMKLGFDREAEIEFKTAMLLDKRSVDPVYHLGMLYESGGMTDASIIEYQRAISMNRDHLLSHYRLYRIYVKKSDMNLTANHMAALFRILKNKKIDRFDRQLVENELVCNLKAFIVEVAVNFSVESKKTRRSGETSEVAMSPSEYLISYEEFAKKGLFLFFDSTELRCPETGKYYTNFVGHVTCPVHGSLPIFTDKIENIKELRARYRRNICAESRRIIEYAVYANDFIETDEVRTIDTETLNMLIKKRHLRDIPECPDGGRFSMATDRTVRCDIHGAQK